MIPMIADIVAVDREGRPVLIVEVKSTPAGEEDVSQFLTHLAAAPETVAFGMLVDPEKTLIFRRDAGDAELVVEFETEAVVRPYYGDSLRERAKQGSARVSHVILAHIIEVWLWDLIFPWKGGDLPKQSEIAEIGLLALLEGGATVNQDMSGAHSLH